MKMIVIVVIFLAAVVHFLFVRAKSNVSVDEQIVSGDWNENEQYVVDIIRVKIASGHYTLDDVLVSMEDILSGDEDLGKLREFAENEFRKKVDEEAQWEEITHCDLLDKVFEILNRRDIIAIQNAGYTMSEGHEDIAEELYARGGRDKAIGYCFYHEQDLERAVKGMGLMLAFGDLDDTDAGKIRIGDLITEVVQECGLECSWNRDPNKRIEIPEITWQRRSPQ